MLIGRTGVCGLVTVIQSLNAEQLPEPALQMGTATAVQEITEKCTKWVLEGLLLELPRAPQHCFGERRRSSHVAFQT